VFAELGYGVVVNHRASAPQAEEVVATIAAAGGEAVAIKADVTVPNDVTAMVDFAVGMSGARLTGQNGPVSNSSYTFETAFTGLGRMRTTRIKPL
jgi:NAD(P)-dependent dehydrogenase (short-subunit alcohol dehydrogenase family)